MRSIKQLVLGLLAIGFSSSALATVLQTWDLTNKSPGALGPDYGLRLNQIDTVGLVPAIAQYSRTILDTS